MQCFNKICLLVLLTIAVTSSQSKTQTKKSPPWIPEWVPCEFDFTAPNHSPICLSCSTSFHCVPIGGIIRTCLGEKPYCNRGKCTSEPSAECQETLNNEFEGSGSEEVEVFTEEVEAFTEETQDFTEDPIPYFSEEEFLV